MKNRDQELTRRRGELIDDDWDKAPERDKDKTPGNPSEGPVENGRAPSGGSDKTGP